MSSAEPRAFSYDQVGRTVEAYSGSESRDFLNNTNSGAPTGPYRQSYQYDALDQITQQTNRLWSQTQATYNTFVNNRLQDWSYDAAGGLTNDGSVSYTRDAAGRHVERGMGGTYYGSKFDGDGRLVGTSLTSANGTLPTYYLNSSVLGLAVAKLYGNGQKVESYVYAGRRKLATATPWQLIRSHVDPVTGSHGHSVTTGYYGADGEFNADGVEVGFAEPTQEEPEFSGFKYPEVVGGAGCYVGNPNCVTVYLDGMVEENWGRVSHLIELGAARQCPDNDCGPRVINGSLRPLTLSQDSRTGLPVFGHWERTDVTVIDPTTGVRISGGPGTPHFRPDFASVNFVGFSFGGVGISTQKTFTIPIGNLRSNLEALLKNGDCRQFTNRVLAALAKKHADQDNRRHIKTVLEGYNMISAQGGYVLESSGISTVRGDLFNGPSLNDVGPGTAVIAYNGQFTPPTAAQIAVNQALFAFVALHETFHLGKRAGYTDEQVGTTMLELDGMAPVTTLRNGRLLSSLPSTDPARAYYFSNEIDQALKRHCGYPTTPLQK